MAWNGSCGVEGEFSMIWCIYQCILFLLHYKTRIFSFFISNDFSIFWPTLLKKVSFWLFGPAAIVWSVIIYYLEMKFSFKYWSSRYDAILFLKFSRKMHQLADFFNKHNLRPFMVVYLALVHIYAVIGMTYSLFHPETIIKVGFPLWRFSQCISPFIWYLRLESQLARIAYGLISPIMPDLHSDFSSCFSPQVGCFLFSCQSRLDLSLVPWSQTSS